MKTLRLLFFLCFVFGSSFSEISSQTKTKKADTVFCDCENARLIKLKGVATVGPTIAPLGPGKEEIKNAGKRNRFLFEKKHHSAWYKIQMVSDGNFSFTIRPLEKKDDYDFLLYKAEDENFCSNFSELQKKPLRSNISRGDTSILGTTGLINEAKHEFEHEGKAPAWSKTVSVKKGEIYYLLLDNVYDNGAGHTIEFFLTETIEASGIVSDKNSNPIKAEITLSDNKGKTLFQTYSDAESGKYKIKVEMTPGVFYTLTYLNDSSFVVANRVNTDSLKKKPLTTKMEKLVKGEKYRLKNINFFGNSPAFIPASKSSVLALCKLMNRNKKIVVQLEGHVNGCGQGAVHGQKLSEDRAAAIKKYLTENEINESRIKTIGYGCSKMLFPNPKNEKEYEENRRVEVKILDF